MIAWLKSRFGHPWEYGMLGPLEARRHVRSGVVQMKRPLGWINFHHDHWPRFKHGKPTGEQSK